MSFALCLVGKNMRKMKITLYYEDTFHPTIQKVPDDECTVMVENDYRQRLDAGADIEARQTEVLPDVPTNMLGEDYADLYTAIKKLRPQQREMIRRVQ